VWHNQLLSYCPDYDKRVRTIEATKPVHEIKPRLAWMQMVKGKWPDEVVRMAEAHGKACKVYDNKAWEVYDKACEAYNQAMADNKDAIEKLHAEECPNCTWDGKTLHFWQNL